jgi:hypothetical protein
MLRRIVQFLLNLPFVTTADRRKTHVSVGGYALLDHAEPSHTMLLKHGEPPSAEMEGGGGGALISVGRLVIDGGGSGAGDTRESATHEVSVGYGQGHISSGVILFENRFLRLYPLAGIGGVGGGIDRTPTAGANGSGDSTEIGWGGGALEIGLGLDLTLKLWRIGLTVGVRAGYQYGILGISRGSEEDFEPPTGPFVRVIFGPRLNP